MTRTAHITCTLVLALTFAMPTLAATKKSKSRRAQPASTRQAAASSTRKPRATTTRKPSRPQRRSNTAVRTRKPKQSRSANKPRPNNLRPASGNNRVPAKLAVDRPSNPKTYGPPRKYVPGNKNKPDASQISLPSDLSWARARAKSRNA